MKKLGKKLNTTQDTIEAYCYCMCDAAWCYKLKGSMTLTAQLGSQGQSGVDIPHS